MKPVDLIFNTSTLHAVVGTSFMHGQEGIANFQAIVRVYLVDLVCAQKFRSLVDVGAKVFYYPWLELELKFSSSVACVKRSKAGTS